MKAENNIRIIGAMLSESLVYFMVCMACPIEQIISKNAIRQCEMYGFHIIIEDNILVEACVCDKKKDWYRSFRFVFERMD